MQRMHEVKKEEEEEEAWQLLKCFNLCVTNFLLFRLTNLSGIIGSQRAILSPKRYKSV